MSIGGSASGIRFSGLSSGLDIDGIVTQLVRLESIPIQRVQRQQAQLQARNEGYNQFRSRLTSLSSALSGLNVSSAFNPSRSASSDKDVAEATAGASAAAGNYTLNVTALAQAQKVTSGAQVNTSDPLNLSGSFVLNGKSITVGNGDNLQQIASKINSAATGVSASVINGGQGQAYISLTSDKSGRSNAIQAADLSGNVLQSLGLFNGASTIREAGPGNRATGIGFSSSTNPLGTVIGQSTSGTILVNGSRVEVDFATDSLQGVADKINNVAAGVTASVVNRTDNGVTTSRLQLNGATLGTSLVDDGQVLASLGIFQRAAGNQLVAAQDAAYTLDGLSLTSSTNSVSEVIPGVTLNLKKVGTTTLNMTRDNDKVKQSIKQFQNAFNDVIGFVRDNSRFDKDTLQSSLLFGDSNLSAVESALAGMVFNEVGSGAFTNLTQIGFGLDSDGKLTLDESKLDSALASNPDAVKNLMMASGSSTNPNLRFVSSGNKTVASNSSGFAVDITRVATKSNQVGNAAQTTANAGGEVLTFNGSLFGNTAINLNVDVGSSASDLVTKINNDSRLRDLVTASLDGSGRLQVESRRWGAAGGFSLTSNLDGPATSGIGTTPTGYSAGVDVAGTINGETATGNGQFLMGAVGNANTEGLQIQYAGTTLGTVGTFNFSKGLSSTIMQRIETFTDSVNGQLSAATKSLQDQIDDMTSRITAMQSQVSLRERTLRERFARMEESLGRLNSQGGQIAAALGSGG